MHSLHKVYEVNMSIFSGVCQLGVVVNKLDTVSWSQERFEEVVGKLGAFLRQAGFRESDVTFVPCSGLTGENLISPPSECMLLQWYKGPCLLDVIGMLVL